MTTSPLPTSERAVAVRRWIEALRSGKYQQARDRLRSHEGFCCLGVACNLFDATRWRGVRDGATYEGMLDELPDSVRKSLGLRTDDGTFHVEPGTETARIGRKYAPDAVCLSLSHLNDAGATFEEIASVIADEPPGLFDDEPREGERREDARHHGEERQ